MRFSHILAALLFATVAGCSSPPDVSTPEKAAESFVAALNGGDAERLLKLLKPGALELAEKDCVARQAKIRELPANKNPNDADDALGLGKAIRAMSTAFLATNCAKLQETNQALARFVKEKGGVTLVLVMKKDAPGNSSGKTGFAILPPGAEKTKENLVAVILEQVDGKWLVSTVEDGSFADGMLFGAASPDGAVPPGNLLYGFGAIRRWAVSKGFTLPQ